MLPVLMLVRGAEALDTMEEDRRFAAMSQHELRLDLVRAIESLPTSYREVVVLRDFEELTIGEIAAKLNVSRDAVKGRLSRARALLREFLLGPTDDGGVR